MAVEVRDITPPALIPLAEVRDAVQGAFIADARRRFQEERAAALLAAVRGGTSLADAARAIGANPEEIGPFPRQPGAGNPMPREVLAPAFELRGTDATMVQLPRSFAVVQLLSVTPAEVAPDAAPLAALRTEQAQAMAEDLEAQFQAALRARADIRINPRLVQQIAGSGQ